VFPRRITYLRRGASQRVRGWDEEPLSVARARSVVVARTRATGTLEHRSSDSPFLRRTRVVQVSSPPQPPGEGRIANCELRNSKSAIRNVRCGFAPRRGLARGWLQLRKLPGRAAAGSFTKGSTVPHFSPTTEQRLRTEGNSEKLDET
jgi:hypothetical protein